MSDQEILERLGIMFEVYVELAAGKRLKEIDRQVADEKAISLLLKDTLGERYRKINKTTVYRIHKNHFKGNLTYNKLEIEKFCSVNYFADLAACRIEQDEKCRRPSREEERVQNEAHALMRKVASHADDDHSARRASVTSRLTDTSRYTSDHKAHCNASRKVNELDGPKLKGVNVTFQHQHHKQSTKK